MNTDIGYDRNGGNRARDPMNQEKATQLDYQNILTWKIKPQKQRLEWVSKTRSGKAKTSEVYELFSRLYLCFPQR